MDQKWYQDFVADENLDRDMLFDLLTAANFMGIKPLLDLTCLKVTFQLTGKNAGEVSPHNLGVVYGRMWPDFVSCYLMFYFSR